MKCFPPHCGLLLLLLLSTELCCGSSAREPELFSNGDFGMDIVLEWGYPLEKHPVTTKDDYILGVYRLPREGAPPVLLQHGLEDSSFGWVANLPNESLAYILYDAGYDVWLGNNRGNEHSRKQEHRESIGDFWDFSFDEMIQFDWPDVIAHILEVTGQRSLGYVGHSQGTMQAFGGLSTTDSVAFFGALAPVAYTSHIRGAIRLLCDLGVDKVLAATGARGFLDHDRVLNTVVPLLCDTDEKLCPLLMEGIVGPSTHQNSSRYGLYLSATPSGTSIKNIRHFGQGVRESTFARYDYGSVRNLQRYGTTTPPPYDLASIKTPIALFSGGADYLATPTDVNRLASELGSSNITHFVEPSFAHLDFTWSPAAASLIYAPLLSELRRYLPLRSAQQQ